MKSHCLATGLGQSICGAVVHLPRTEPTYSPCLCCCCRGDGGSGKGGEGSWQTATAFMGEIRRGQWDPCQLVHVRWHGDFFRHFYFNATVILKKIEVILFPSPSKELSHLLIMWLRKRMFGIFTLSGSRAAMLHLKKSENTATTPTQQVQRTSEGAAQLSSALHVSDG